MYNVKKTFYLMIAIAVIGLTGCSSDDDGGGPTGPQVSSSLYGDWTLDLLIVNGETEGNFPCEEEVDYRFNSDNSYTKTRFNTNSSGNCEQSLEVIGNWEALTEQSILLTPNSSEVDSETINFELISNNTKLEITRSSSRTEIYERP